MIIFDTRDFSNKWL